MRIGIIGNNSPEYIKLLISIWNQDDSAVLIDSNAPPRFVSKIVSEANISRIYIENTLCSAFLSDISSDIITPYQSDYKIPCILPESIRCMFKSRYDEKEAVVIYSSGTTGGSKGISLSHRALNNNADSIIEYMKPTPNDCLYLNKKITHAASLTGELLVSLKSGANILVSPIIIHPRIVFKNIDNYNVTVLCCNPFLINIYTDEAEKTKLFPKSVRTVYSSGDIISVASIERARKIFQCPVYNAYGQTECGPRISVQTNDYCHANSSGKPIKNVEVRIDDNGEILVSTNALFSGYVGLNLTSERWHRTGDLGEIDDYGELFIKGRTDNMIVFEAHNIYPEIVEQEIIGITDIIDCLVYMNNNKLICDYISKSDIDTITVIKTLKHILLPYEIPRVYRRVSNIPRNVNGKKLRV